MMRKGVIGRFLTLARERPEDRGERMGSKVFDKGMSTVIKGIAVLMMLFHHLFRDGLEAHERFDIIYFPFPEINMINIATVFKICVGMFAFVSGYGLYLDLKKSRPAISKWVLVREVKVLSSFWPVVICVWIFGQLVGHHPQDTYFTGGGYLYTGPVNMLAEFFGCARLFGTPTLNSEWWYMSAAVIYVAMAPLIVRNEDKVMPILALIVALPRVLGIGFLGGINAYPFIFVFLLGMICAKVHFFDRIAARRHRLLRILIEAVLVLIGYKFYRKIPISTFWEFQYGIYPLIVIVFCVEILEMRCFRWLYDMLLFVGKHSANIYFVQYFVIFVYLTDFIYKRAHFLITYFLTFAVCLVLSLSLEYIKKKLGYGDLIRKLCGRIECWCTDLLI